MEEDQKCTLPNSQTLSGRMLSEGARFMVRLPPFDGASDTVPHHLLIEAPQRMGAEALLLRLIALWSQRRTLSARLRTASGTHRSRPRAVFRGLPQGCVLSLFLGSSSPNGVRPLLEQYRAA